MTMLEHLHRRLGQWQSEDIPDLLAECQAVIDMLSDALRDAARNDNTAYDHHQPRRWDGRPPDIDGGTIWLTPREIARYALGEPELATTAELIRELRA